MLTIKLFATFQKGRFEAAQRECPPGTTLGKIVDELGIAREEIGVLLVSGRHAELEHVPATGDTIAIFPLLGGG
ncbi:MAG TPA: MoaD/ThiS family protein [Anaeromyxobacter sp.]|nr:MoaD/ThiS family protein [Anaeromyxobacter sp.]